MPLGPAPLDAPFPAPSAPSASSARAQTAPATRKAAPLKAGARELFTDARGTGMRVSWHPERGVVVLSTWKRDVCTGTFHLPLDEAPRLAEFLAAAGAATSGVESSDAEGRTTGADGEPPAAGATRRERTPRAVDDRTVPLQVLRGDRRR